MSISGKQTINIGLPNQSANSDSLFEAFTKANTNFNTLFSCASPFSNFISSSGIDIDTDASSGEVTITNTGVTQLIPGPGVVLSNSTGNITIAFTGGNGTGVGTVTSIGVVPVSSTRLTTSNSPVVSEGNIAIDLVPTGVTAGSYQNPNVTVDQYGRVMSMSNGSIAGTVTSIGLTPGPGIQINGGPITSNGNITVTNTGVTSLNAGSGINLSSGNGNVTISAQAASGTVTSVGVSSTQLVVTGSPVVSSGTIGINLPNSVTFSGNVDAGNIKTDNLLYANGDPWDLQEAAGGNFEIQFNENDDFSASANLRFDPTTQELTVVGDISATEINANAGNINGDLTVIGNTAANGVSATEFTTSGNVTANVIVAASNSNINFTGNLLPTSNTFSLGSSDDPWESAYFGPQSITIQDNTGNAANAVIFENEAGNVTLASAGFKILTLGNSATIFRIEALTGQIFSNARTIIQNTTDSANATSGSLQTAGGAGIAKSLYVGNNIIATGNITASNLGNVSAINLDGNSANYLDGTGTWGPVTSSLSGDGETIEITSGEISVINLPANTEIGPIEQLSFNTSHTHQETRVVGTLCWDPDDQTLNLTHPGDVTQQIGQELYAKVRNNTGNTIPAGTAVRFAGASVNGTARLEIAPFEADGAFPSLYGLGITTQDIDDSEDGRVTVWGKIRDINTTGQNGETWNVGDILYVSTTVAGGLTKVKPTAPNNVIPMAAVLRVDATEGEIFVRPTIEQQQSYGVFERTTDLSVTQTNTANVVQFDTTEISNGVEIVSGNTSRLQVNQSGLYQVDISAQVDATGGGFSSGTMYIWLRKNGVDVADSTRRQGVLDSAPSASIGFSIVISLDADDYIEIGYAGDNTDLRFDAAAATAFAPSAAAVKVGVTQVQL